MDKSTKEMIKLEYIKGESTQQEIAKKYKTTRQSISTWAKEGNWAKAKEKYKLTVAQSRELAKSKEVAKKREDLEMNTMNVANSYILNLQNDKEALSEMSAKDFGIFVKSIKDLASIGIPTNFGQPQQFGQNITNNTININELNSMEEIDDAFQKITGQASIIDDEEVWIEEYTED